MNTELKRRFALWMLILTGVLLLYGIIPFLTGVFGAIILFTLFSPFYEFLKKKRFPEKLSATLTMLLSIIIIVVPLVFIVAGVTEEINNVIAQRDAIVSSVGALDALIPGIEFTQMIKERLPQILNASQTFLLSAFKGVANALLNIILMYFLLYYMLINKKRLRKKAIELVPFNPKNSQRLMDEVKRITDSTVITSGLIALMQGLLLGLGLWVLGVNNVLLWSFVGFVLAFIPVLGIPIIWIPASIIFAIQQNYFAAVAIFIWGAVLSNADNIVRPYIQHMFSDIHPLIIVVGLFVGLPLFGILGIIIGPLLVSYFLLLGKMYLEEYG